MLKFHGKFTTVEPKLSSDIIFLISKNDTGIMKYTKLQSKTLQNPLFSAK